MAKYLQSSENIPINETGDNISFNLSNNILSKIGKIDSLETKYNNLTNYSTEEQVIGKWIDGKPLYRRVFIGTKGHNNTQVNVGSIIDVNDIIKIQGTLGSDDKITQSVGGYMDSQNNNSFIYFDYGKNSITLVAPKTYNGKYIITIEYTKTTD